MRIHTGCGIKSYRIIETWIPVRFRQNLGFSLVLWFLRRLFCRQRYVRVLHHERSSRSTSKSVLHSILDGRYRVTILVISNGKSFRSCCKVRRQSTMK